MHLWKFSAWCGLNDCTALRISIDSIAQLASGFEFKGCFFSALKHFLHLSEEIFDEEISYVVSHIRGVLISSGRCRAQVNEIDDA